MASSLFEKYGGFSSISKIVSAFYDKAIDSDEIGPYFDNVDMRSQIDHQTKFIASLMGGPASYSDDALRKVHAGHNIDQAAYDEMAALLRETLEEFDLHADDVDQVMSEIAARSNLVITRR